MKDNLKEVAMIAAIISDQFCKELYNEYKTYLGSLEVIANAAIEFNEKYPVDKTDWAAFQDKNEFSDTGCDWDEFVTHWAYHYFIKNEMIPADSPNPAEMNFED